MSPPLRRRYGHMAPAVLRKNGYVFRFVSADGSEPPHVHVEYGGGEAKFWLDPVHKAWARRMKKHDERRAERYVRSHAAELLEGWHEHFGT